MENKNESLKERICVNYVKRMISLMNIIRGRLCGLENPEVVIDVFRVALHKIHDAVQATTVDDFEFQSAALNNVYELCNLFATMAAHMRSELYGDIFFECAQKMFQLTSSIGEYLESGYIDKYVERLARKSKEDT